MFTQEERKKDLEAFADEEKSLSSESKLDYDRDKLVELVLRVFRATSKLVVKAAEFTPKNGATNKNTLLRQLLKEVEPGEDEIAWFSTASCKEADRAWLALRAAHDGVEAALTHVANAVFQASTGWARGAQSGLQFVFAAPFSRDWEEIVRRGGCIMHMGTWCPLGTEDTHEVDGNCFPVQASLREAMRDKPEREGWFEGLDCPGKLRVKTLFADVLLTKERHPAKSTSDYSFKLVKERYSAEERAALRYFTQRFMTAANPKAVYCWGRSNERLLPNVRDWATKQKCALAVAKHPSWALYACRSRVIGGYGGGDEKELRGFWEVAVALANGSNGRKIEKLVAAALSAAQAESAAREEEKKAKKRAQRRAREADPAVKEQRKAYEAKPEVKEQRRARDADPAVKAKRKARDAEPEVKEQRKARDAQPEAIDRRRARQASAAYKANRNARLKEARRRAREAEPEVKA